LSFARTAQLLDWVQNQGPFITPKDPNAIDGYPVFLRSKTIPTLSRIVCLLSAYLEYAERYLTFGDIADCVRLKELIVEGRDAALQAHAFTVKMIDAVAKK
jgi:hypothetical protein